MLSIEQIVIDCADAARLAGFWSRALSRPVDEGASEYFAVIGGTPKLMFLKVPEPKKVKNRLHLDLSGPGWVGEVERLLTLGATKISEHQEYGTEWVTLADPEGNEFDVGAGLPA